jgi:hypothetical protein
VRYFESEGNYVRVRFDDQKPLVLRSLNKLEEKLDPLVYFRASRKHIINLRWVDKIEPWFNGGLMVKLKSLDKNGSTGKHGGQVPQASGPPPLQGLVSGVELVRGGFTFSTRKMQ